MHGDRKKAEWGLPGAERRRTGQLLLMGVVSVWQDRESSGNLLHDINIVNSTGVNP